MVSETIPCAAVTAVKFPSDALTVIVCDAPTATNAACGVSEIGGGVGVGVGARLGVSLAPGDTLAPGDPLALGDALSGGDALAPGDALPVGDALAPGDGLSLGDSEGIGVISGCANGVAEESGVVCARTETAPHKTAPHSNATIAKSRSGKVRRFSPLPPEIPPRLGASYSRRSGRVR
jgi:hypothetical protein